MTKLLLVTYYGIRESLQSAASALEGLGYRIVDYPILKHGFDPHSKREDYPSHFDQCIRSFDPRIILFWSFAISYGDLCKLRKDHPHRIFGLFNWDDPHCWKVSENDMVRKASLLDVAFTSCRGIMERYEQCGVRRVVFCPPAFDPSVHRYTPDPEYECDVSMCCTNFYDEDEEQRIPRRELVNRIVRDGSIRFHLYGPISFAHQYPDNYMGWVDYATTCKVYSNSRINLCHHLGSEDNPSHRTYVNERTMLVAGSRGLMLVSAPSGFEELFRPNEECIMIDPTDPVSQIKDILSNRGEYDALVERGYRRALDRFTYDRWADTIHRTLVVLVQ